MPGAYYKIVAHYLVQVPRIIDSHNTSHRKINYTLCPNSKVGRI